MKDTVSIDVLLDQLVVEKSLAPGAQLPPLDDLAADLGRPAAEIEQVLAVATAKGRFVRAADGGFVVAAPRVKEGAPVFSFATTAAQHHERLITAMLEPTLIRLPRDEQHPLHAVELRAQEALGLAVDQPFLAIARVRHLGGNPRVFHRVYLDPARFAPGFVEGHDLVTQSIMDMYCEAGYRLLSRDTVLRSRLTNRYEDNVLRDLGRQVHLQPVLHAEQRFFATRVASEEGADDRFVLEYMQATYFDGWQYSIHNRPPG